MGKFKLSTSEKKLIRTVLVYVLIQSLIVLAFMSMFRASHPVNIQDTKQIDITVEDTYYISIPKHSQLVVVATSGKYSFVNYSRFDEYSANEIYESISKGDKLSLTYYEGYSIVGKINRVVAAQTENETYRSLQGYIRGHQGLPAIIVLIFSIIEFVFIGLVLISTLLDKNIAKGLIKKLKQHLR